MKKTLKILFYFSIILFIVFLFISKTLTNGDEVIKVIIEKEANSSKETKQQINQKPSIEAGDEQNITFSENNVTAIAKDKDGYWLLVKLHSYQDAKVNRIYRYDDKGREVMNIYKYDNHAMKEQKTLHKYTDDGKVKELNVIFSTDGEVYRDTKTIYNEHGNIAKEVIVSEEGLLGETSLYEIEHHYNDEEQLLEVEVIAKNGKFISQKNEYKNGKLISKRYFNRNGDVSGLDYVYKDGILRESRDFGEFWVDSKFYNAKGLLIAKTYGYGNRAEYTYDKENRLIEEKKDTQKKHFFYNKDGKKIKEEYLLKNSDGTFEQVSYTTFDEEKIQKVSLIDGSTIETFYAEKEVTKREVYDEHGNLIEVWDDAINKLIERRFYRFVLEKE